MSDTAERIKAARERDEAKLRAEGIDPDASDETEPTPEPTPEPEPEPTPDEPGPPPSPAPPPVSERDVEAIGKKIDRAAANLEKSLRAALGDDLDAYLPCPLCVIPGHVIPYQGGPVDPDQRAAVMAALGEPEAQLKQDEEAEMCERCGGWGKLLTGAKDPTYQTRACPNCAGQGWRQKATPVPAAAPAPAPYMAGAYPAAPTNGPLPPPPTLIYDHTSGKYKTLTGQEVS